MKPLPNDLIDALLVNYKKPEDLIGQNGLLKQLTQALDTKVDEAAQATKILRFSFMKVFQVNTAGIPFGIAW